MVTAAADVLGGSSDEYTADHFGATAAGKRVWRRPNWHRVAMPSEACARAVSSGNRTAAAGGGSAAAVRPVGTLGADTSASAVPFAARAFGSGESDDATAVTVGNTPSVAAEPGADETTSFFRSVRVVVGDKFIQDLALLRILEREFNVWCVERDTEAPVDVIIDGATCACIVMPPDLSKVHPR